MQSNNQITRRQRTFSTLCGLLTSASLLLTSVAAAPIPRSAQTGTPTDPQAVPAETATPTPAQTPAVTSANDAARVNFRQIIIKFKGETGVQANAAGLTSLQQALPNLALKPLFPQAEQVLPETRVSALAKSGSYAPGLDRYVVADLGQDVTFEDAQKTLETIQLDPSVELAYMEPVYLPASPLLVPPGDLTGSQGYLENSGNGIHARYAWTLPGGKGEKIQLIDIDAGWQIGHEDLNISANSIIEGGNSSDQQWISHGTSVLGVVAARLNEFGVTGIAPSTYLQMINTISVLPAQAIIDATLNLNVGDILLIPTQMLGPRKEGHVLPPDCDPAGFESVPIEYAQANYDAIYAATLKGIIVVEAAGNGAVNLDNSLYGSAFNRSNRNSGAILVGAGDSVTREPICNANYGKQIDVQGWGNNVATTGIDPITGLGDLYQGEDADGNPDPNEAYTATFGGSSAAAAMVAGAAASLQGVATNRGYILSPSQVRSILRSTGTAQGGDATAQQIGPLPNLEEAFNKKLTKGVRLLSPEDGSSIRILRPTLVWQSFLDATQYELQLSKGDSNFGNLVRDIFTSSTEYVIPSNLTNNATYFWRVRPQVNDVWLDWPASGAFQFTVYGSGAPLVTLKTPINGLATSDYTPTFTWKLPSSTTPPPDGYQLVLSKNYDFSNSLPTVDIPDGTTFTTTLGTALDQNSRYYWRMRSYFTTPAGQDFGAWSGRFTLYTRIDISGLNPVVLPAPDLYTDTLRPTFDWNDIANAKKYEINIAAVQNFSTTVLKAELKIPSGETIPTSTFRPGVDLPKNKTLYWRVRVFGDYTWSDWSPAALVFADLSPTPPGAPTLLLPANLKAYGYWETGVTLTWKRPTTALPPANGYQVQLATAKTFTGDDLLLTDDALETGDPLVLPSYDLSGLQSESVYYWRVRAVGDTGVGPWSAIWTFYTTPPIPTGTDIVDGLSLRPTFTWDKSTDDRSYQVQVARDSDTIDDKTKLFGGTRLITTMTTLSSPPFTSTTPFLAGLPYTGASVQAVFMATAVGANRSSLRP